MVLIPIQNFQGMPDRLEKGVDLEWLDSHLPNQVTIDSPQTVDLEIPHVGSRCASVQASVNLPERLQKHVQVQHLTS